MTTYSVLLPFMPLKPEHVLPYAAFVEHRAPYRLWQGQSVSIEPHQLFTYAAAAGFRFPAGTGVTLMPFRHPMEAALQARSLAITLGHPYVAGFGPAATALQRDMYGAPYRSPLTATREYLNIVRALLRGEPIDQAGEYFSYHGVLLPIPSPPVEIGLGVLRPGMAKLAGELADVAITWLTPPQYLAEHILPALRQGAAAAGREVPRLVAMVPVALAGPGRDPVRLALAGNRPHLERPHYRDMLRQAGIHIDPGDLDSSARTLVDTGTFCYGEPAELGKLLDAYRAAGVDELVVNMTGACQTYGARVVLNELLALFDEIGHDDG